MREVWWSITQLQHTNNTTHFTAKETRTIGGTERKIINSIEAFLLEYILRSKGEQKQGKEEQGNKILMPHAGTISGEI